MADVIIQTSDAAGYGSIARSIRNIVWTSTTVGYHFYVDTADDLMYKKTTDGGATWGSAVSVEADITVAYDVWYDQWTSGDSGTKIHIATFGSTSDDVNYYSLDTASDTLSGPVTIFAGATAVAGRGTFCSIAKMRGGNLYCAFDIDAGAEHGLYRSTDGGSSWGSRTDPVEATLDFAFLFPGNETDTNDLWILYFDADANDLTLKVHDDSADTNSESSSIMGVTENTTDAVGQHPFQAAVRHSDGHLIVAAWSERDTVTADFRVFDINGASSITELTAIATNVDDSYHPCVCVDAATDDIYIGYIGKRDGSETLGGIAGVYYVKSTDGGTSWSAGDTAYSASTSSFRQTYCAPNGPRFAIVWCAPTPTQTQTNADNAVDFAAPPASEAGPVIRGGPLLKGCLLRGGRLLC